MSIRPLPKELEALYPLALDMRRASSFYADELWGRLAPELWARTRNPWMILRAVPESRLLELARDEKFVNLLDRHTQIERPNWFKGVHLNSPLQCVAYFSMEYGLGEALPIYSGGLGILAGDHLKAASDLGVPLIAVGLLYQQGYFRQGIDASGDQVEFFPYNEPGQLPVEQVIGLDGDPFRLKLPVPGRLLTLRVWEVKVGRVRLLLLDTNDLLNSPPDRAITSELYGGGPELRIQQEMVLGIGGWMVLEALGYRPDICHLNEGHAAFAILERARSCGGDFYQALAATRSTNLFTTHTPVEAGFDRFNPWLVGQYLGPYCERVGITIEELLALGRMHSDDEKEPLNMAYLAVRGSGAVNGVSQLHGSVSEELFKGLDAKVGYVTNGVHVPSWESPEADRLWTEACGEERWHGDLATLEQELRAISDEQLWTFRNEARASMIDYARTRLLQELHARAGDISGEFLDPDVLTLGFARRFATYKRPDLLLRDPERLVALLDGKLQLIIAGKAHPQDEEGKAIVSRWIEFVKRHDVRGKVIFLADYDILLAERLVQGVDIWLNTPLRPWEASGTSGMKVLVNGGLNLSSLDGWWAEGYTPDVGWPLRGTDDYEDSKQLYRLLEEEIVPTFYRRDERGMPVEWLRRVRESMATLTPQFSTNRMVREYTENYYLPALERAHARS